MLVRNGNLLLSLKIYYGGIRLGGGFVAADIVDTKNVYWCLGRRGIGPSAKSLKLELLLELWGLHLPCVLPLCVGLIWNKWLYWWNKRAQVTKSPSCACIPHAGAVYLLRLFPSESIYYQNLILYFNVTDSGCLRTSL